MANKDASRKRTVSDAKCCSSIDKIILELVVEKAKGSHQNMEKDPNSKEKVPATFIYHP
jgi:hypothetical protein